MFLNEFEKGRMWTTNDIITNPVTVSIEYYKMKILGKKIMHIRHKVLL